MALDSNSLKIMADLKRKRGVIKAALTRTRNFVNSFDPRVEAISLLEFRQEELPRINHKFDDIQSEIELLCPDDVENSERERDDFERSYFAIRSQIQEIINLEKHHNSSGLDASATIANLSAAQPRARLAPVDLPKFNGNIQEWETFFDCFKVMVHQEDYYSPAQKFYYLRSVLGGQALDLIKSLPMTGANYALALKKLETRYNNRDLVVQAHIREILHCPRIESASAQELLKLHSHISAHVSALEALKLPIEHWDAWLVTIIIERMDNSTSQDWQLRRTNTELSKYTELMEFLSNRSIALEGSEALSINTEQFKEINLAKTMKGKRYSSGGHSKGALLVASDVKEICAYCSSTHKLYTCTKFKDLSIGNRINFVRKAKLCFNCLHPSHLIDKCRSRFNCFICKKKHNTLLHFEEQNEGSVFSGEDKSEEIAALSSKQNDVRKSLLVHQGHGHVFLSTAVVLVRDNQGNCRQCNAILDSGSQVNFISKKLARQLQLSSERAALPISGIGANTLHSSTSINIQVESRFGQSIFNLSCYVLPTIVSQLQPVCTPVDGWKIPNDMLPQLADPHFHDSKQVDLLIGGGAFFDILLPKRLPLDVKMLHLQDSKLGWIVTGEMSNTCLLGAKESLEDDWKAIHNNEDTSYGKSSKANQCCIEERQALEHFYTTVSRNEEGRFVLQLPVKPELINLGQSINSATARFLSVERKLQQDADLRVEYTKFMKEYLMMGHMQEVSQESNIPERSYYLPHHAVFKTSSLTTKVRVVFDASAKTSSGLSLNDVLMRGPKTQDDIFSILTRYRKHQYVISSDIEKMFRQVAVAEQDCNLQRILWRDDPSEALRTYKLVTVTYGTTPASFMTTQCLVTLAQQALKTSPRAANAILRDFYMDDLMTGGETQEECIQLYQEITSILDSAKLPLRKWCSNSAFILKYIGREVRDPLFTLEIGDEEMVKSLGLCWKPLLDEFRFNITHTPLRSKLTKRALLSDLNKVFDPLGFISPVLLRGKIFLQQIWAMKIDWDSSLPSDLQNRWRLFCEDLEQLQYISIPRKVIPEICNTIQIHGFSDASQEAYGACMYVRSRSNNGNWHSRLLCSKTRVAPLKVTTIPRLELNGALLLADLASKVADSWSLNIKSFWFWTDSTIVLGWINSEGNRLKTYVANRVNQILDQTLVTQWRHVQTVDNPADWATRGLSSCELPKADKWWKGPKWLEEDCSSNWVPSTTLINEEDLPERKKIKLALITTKPGIDIISTISDWNRLLRSTAWLLIFIDYLKKKQRIQAPKYLTVPQLRRAELVLLKRVQAECFQKEITALENGKEVSRGSKLKGLYPFIKNGLLLVGGRIQNANISDYQKHPIVLPSGHRLTRLIFESCHREMLHCGPQALLAQIRRRFWPLLGRLTARAVVRKCVRCVRARPIFNHPLMAPLPKLRVQNSRPFATTGIDFAGPFIIRSGIRRVTGKKAWLAVFVCFTTRAIHLEVVEDMTSAAFLASLKRFISRRGRCAIIYSDNGTNFVGTQKELSAFITKGGPAMANEGIEWRFNPPSSPHFGGLWEAAVKSAKHHFKRVMGETKLTLAEFSTLICQVEACLNSRPITPMSSEPYELEALTPAHFLVGGPLMLPMEADISQEVPGSLRRWKHVQYILQTFWRRWYAEYLPQCQLRGKWVNKKRPLELNDIVIIKDECTPPTRWNLGRVIQLHPGIDGTVRVVTIRLATGAELKRPAVKLCVLPTEADWDAVETQGFNGGENVGAQSP